MDYEFFHGLSDEEARECLEGFRATESVGLEQLRPLFEADGICPDYSLDSLGNVLKWLVGRATCNRAPAPKNVPTWIRESNPEVIEFDEDSKYLILRGAYYLGECFARLPGMHWTVGNPDYMEKNMPVVTGFRDDEELPPLVVTEVMFAKIVGHGAPLTEIDSGIAVWRSMCPACEK